MKNIGTVFLLLYSLLSYSQEKVNIRGFVIDDYGNILPDVKVSIRNKEIKTYTNYKGKFTIECNINDSLEFESIFDNYVPVIYAIKNDSLLIVNLSNKLIYENGRKKLRGRAEKIRFTQAFDLSNTIYNKQSINLGYTYFLNPYFSNIKYNPIDDIGLGLNLCFNNQKGIVFQNITFNFKNFYSIHNSFLSFSMPQISLGYIFNSLNSKPNNSFGYNLKINLFSTRIRAIETSITLSYNNYSAPSEVFMLGLSIMIRNKHCNKLEIIH